MSLDQASPDVLYASRQVGDAPVWATERWETPDHGKTWKTTQLTPDPKEKNIRPVAVRGAHRGEGLQVLWMQGT